MVKVLVAPDKFKGSLTAREVCEAAEDVMREKKNFHVTSLPLADGGEGTFEILMDHFRGYRMTAVVHDPLMRRLETTYGVSNDGATAFIEMAKASGLQLLTPAERNPLITSTYGTGELIAHALESGVKQIVLGIGGSATNDAGVGMACALGFRFYNNGKPFSPRGGKEVGQITDIDRSTAKKELADTEFTTLCDVTNPLTGERGASRIFAPQKGATPEDVKTLESNLTSFESLLEKRFNFSARFDGAGAAGGLGAAVKFFLSARLITGFDYMARTLQIEKHIQENDIVITGEGRLDRQSLSGKVVGSVTKLAKSCNKKVIVVCGVCDLNDEELRNLGIDEYLELSQDIGIEFSIQNAPSRLKHILRRSKVLQGHQ